MSDTIHIIGAGPAGLTAAINLAKANVNVVLHEQNSDVGLRLNRAELTLNPSLVKRGTWRSPSLSKRRGWGMS